jgi:hypothetical protein
MDGCSLFALLACFNWSGLYLDGGLQYQNADVERIGHYESVNHEGNAIETVITPFPYTADENPYGRVALGYELHFARVTISAEAFYSGSFKEYSAPSVKGLALKARWYPFR